MSEGKQEAGKQVQNVKESVDSELLVNAESEGIDVDTIIENQIAENAKYGASTISRFAETAIRRELEAANAETVEGILLGSRDRHGANWPRRHSVIRSDGEHMQVSTWDGSLPAGDGTEMEMPSGNVVSMEVDYDEEYDSYEGRRINNVRELDSPSLAENLEKVAMDPSDLTAGDEYETRVIKGRIQYINPQTMFTDGEPDGDGAIMMEDDRGQLRPHFEVVLENDDETRFRAHAERQSYGRPHFEVPDLEALCLDAYERYEEPDRQAQFVGDGLRGVEVVLVGNVSGYSRDRDGDGNPVTYVDMGLTGMVGIEQNEDQQGLDKFAESEGDGETAGEEADEAADEAADDPTPDAGGSDGGSEDADDEGPEDPGTFEDYEPDDDGDGDASNGASESFECDNCGKTFDSQPALNGHKGSCDTESDESEPESPASDGVEVVRESILDYCNLTGEAFEDMTVEDVNENLGGVDADDAVIRAALAYGEDGGGGADEADEDTDGGEESAGDVAERLLEENDLSAAGTFACPVDDCLASAGSGSGVLGHAKADHETDGYDSPVDWLRDEIGA